MRRTRTENRTRRVCGTVIIALGEEKNFGVLLQVFDFKNEKWIPLMKKPEYGYQGMIPMSDYVAIFKEHGRTEAIVYNSKTGKRLANDLYILG